MSNRRQLACFLIILCLAIFARAQNPFETSKQFSATVITTGGAAMGRMAQGDMKIFRSGDKMRTNIGTMGYMIMDLNQHINYMVMNGMCMQMAPSKQSNPFSTAQGATIDRSPAGTDTVDGHACKVENLTVTAKDGQPTKMKVWEAQDLKGFPVKVEIQSTKGTITVQYKDVSFDEPQASLFTHPDNCQQMSMPSGPPSQ